MPAVCLFFISDIIYLEKEVYNLERRESQNKPTGFQEFFWDTLLYIGMSELGSHFEKSKTEIERRADLAVNKAEWFRAGRLLEQHLSGRIDLQTLIINMEMPEAEKEAIRNSVRDIWDWER